MLEFCYFYIKPNRDKNSVSCDKIVFRRILENLANF